MQITLNGEQKNIAESLTVTELMASLKLDARKVAIERNLEIVPRSQYDSVRLAKGDRLEIVQFIGGG